MDGRKGKSRINEQRKKGCEATERRRYVEAKEG